MKDSLYNAISTISQSFYDELIEANAEFKIRSGIKTVIIRRMVGNCCPWCEEKAGIYDYSDAPDDVFARHDNCRCMVTVKSEKSGYQDAWSKKEYKTQRDARIARSQEIEADQSFWNSSVQARRQAKAEGQRCFDATEEWLHRSGKSIVIENNKKEMYVDGQRLVIDGIKNKYDPDPRESSVADLIANKMGVRVEINPKINNPQSFPLSDYFINSVRFDKKTPEGSGSHTIYNIIKEHEAQAHSFVIDLHNNTLSSEEAIRQINDDVFRSVHTKFVDTIILVDNDDNIKVFERL